MGVVSDWTHLHALFPASGNPAIATRVQRRPRWVENWYLRHPEIWWPQSRRIHGLRSTSNPRDWNMSLGTATFEPVFDYAFDISPEAGHGSLNTTDELNGKFLATAGSLTVTAGNDAGTYTLDAGGPKQTTSLLGSFLFDNLLFPTTNPPLDGSGLLFSNSSMEINIWGNSAGNYSYYDSTGAGLYGMQLNEAGALTMNVDPGAGQIYPAKYVFDVTASPSCTNDYVVIGIPSAPASGGQANIVGYDNLYASSTGTGYCPGRKPKVKFAYASGSGEVPGSITLSLDGSQVAYVENLLTGSSYFHVLTIGTTGNNGTSATKAAVPGSASGNNAVDERVLLSPDGTTSQSSTTSPYVNYSADTAYVTTYTWDSGGSGYLYKVSHVFGAGTPAILWSIPVDAVPSSPVYDSVSNKVFFTDSDGRIDAVTDSGSSPAVEYGAVVAPGSTSLNPVTIDSVNQMIYATFNTDGSNAVVVQTPTSLSGDVTVPVGPGSKTFTGPYGVTFNNAWYAGSGTPMLYVAGTSTGAIPTLDSVGFNANGVMDSSVSNSAPLASGMADASPVTEFYNSSTGTDRLFVGVTNHCIATSGGGRAGCVMSLDVTKGFPVINAATTAIAAKGGSSGIIIDNDSGDAQASSVYYTTKTGATLVKATQSGLN